MNNVNSPAFAGELFLLKNKASEFEMFRSFLISQQNQTGIRQ